MTLPPVIRIFFAIDLSESVKERIAGLIATLKKASKTNSIRWSKPENLHITLQFLAEIQSEHVPVLLQNVQSRIEKAIQPIHFNIGTLHLFPNPYRPRVIVLDVLQQESLQQLSALIGDAITATHYTIEDRPFRAHMTLGRIKQPQGMSLNFLEDCALPAFEAVDVHEVVLFRSEPQPEGSKYSVLEKITLAK